MEGLEATCGRSCPTLVELVRQCLHNTPERRPSSKDLLSRLRAVRREVEVAFGGNKQLNIANVIIVKEMKIKDKRIQELQVNMISYLKIRTCKTKLHKPQKKNFVTVVFLVLFYQGMTTSQGKKLTLNDGTAWPSVRCSIIINLHKSWKGIYQKDRAYVTVFVKATG